MGKFFKVTIKELRRFTLAGSFMICLIWGLVLPYFLDRPYSITPWGVALSLSAVSLLAPRLIIIFYVPIIFIGSIIGHLNTKVVLFFLYYFVLTPYSFLLKLFKVDLIDKSFKNSNETYLIRVDRKISIDKPF